MYEILFENNDFIIVYKEYGLLSIKARGGLLNETSLFELLKQKYKELYIVHRLDKDTSGIMIFAKNREAHKNLCFMFEKGHVDKRYLALVWGSIETDNFKVTKPIKEFGSGRMGVSEDGKNAITEFKVLNRFNGFTLLEAKLLTGRRHQIRVHLYYIGNPVVGDKLYGEIEKQKKYKRMMLHSYLISFKYKGKKYLFKNDEKFLKEATAGTITRVY